MVNDSSAPATKQDVSLLMETMGNIYVEIKESEDRMVQQFHVIAEQIHHDAIGANRDEIEVVKDRVTALERHTGLVKA